MKDWGESVSELMIGEKQLQETVRSIVLLGCFYLLYMLCSSLCRLFFASFKLCLCNCCWLPVCIVVVVLCVLLLVARVYCCSCLVCIVVGCPYVLL